jgi:hypothetical protein
VALLVLLVRAAALVELQVLLDYLQQVVVEVLAQVVLAVLVS